jgi:hypothetical protein
MPKIKRKEDDKGSQDRQSEQPSNKPPRNTQKASGPESAIQLPRINRCSAEQGNAGKMGSSASIQNAAKAAIRDWHEELYSPAPDSFVYNSDDIELDVVCACVWRFERLGAHMAKRGRADEIQDAWR